VARLRTDREVLRTIYDRYYDDFVSFERDPSTRGNKVLIPIDIPSVALSLKMEPELLFGRLNYHLGPKHEHVDGNKKITLFTAVIPPQNGHPAERHLINFPRLESVLASLEHEDRKFWLPIVVSSASLAVALCALVFTGMSAFTAAPAKPSVSLQTPSAK
jgi:hypothetical protein